MALLLHPGPVPLASLRGALDSSLPGLPVRLWPEIGDPAGIRYALVSRVPQGALASLPGLRLAGSLHAGIDHLLRDSGLPRNVPLTRPVPEGGDAAMSEYILAQVLSHHRNLPAYARAQREARWRRRPLVAAGQRTVSFLGLGAMASPAAELLRQVGFDVAAWVRRPREGAAIPVFHGPDGLRALAARSQILVNMLPLTDATENIVDASLLALLPPGAALVNVGRGEHVVDADLLAALDRGHLSAATLDVFRTEPLPPDSPFWRHPGISITPHACRQVDVAAVVAQFAEEIQRVERGEAPLRAVDRQAGY
jgi:glyoxylate/hydroxypyruvate reductase A